MPETPEEILRRMMREDRYRERRETGSSSGRADETPEEFMKRKMRDDRYRERRETGSSSGSANESIDDFMQRKMREDRYLERRETGSSSGRADETPEEFMKRKMRDDRYRERRETGSSSGSANESIDDFMQRKMREDRYLERRETGSSPKDRYRERGSGSSSSRERISFDATRRDNERRSTRGSWFGAVAVTLGIAIVIAAGVLMYLLQAEDRSESPSESVPASQSEAPQLVQPTPALLPLDILEEEPVPLIESSPETPPIVTGSPVWARYPSAREFRRVYPRRALARGVEGRVTLRCVSDAAGRLSCSVLTENPIGWHFGDAALNLFEDARVERTLSDGRSVEGTEMRLPLAFRVDGAN
jgi:hypothetical protein